MHIYSATPQHVLDHVTFPLYIGLLEQKEHAQRHNNPVACNM